MSFLPHSLKSSLEMSGFGELIWYERDHMVLGCISGAAAGGGSCSRERFFCFASYSIIALLPALNLTPGSLDSTKIFHNFFISYKPFPS